MHQLARHTGSWVGTNGFRLMAADPLHDAPAAARVTQAAKGALTEIAYTWSHAEDDEQSGLLVLGAGDEPDSIVAFWGDSWHQQPSPQVLEGTADGDVLTVRFSYAGDWGWEIAVDVSSPDVLALEMRNVIPASAATDTKAAGPYVVMTAPLARAA